MRETELAQKFVEYLAAFDLYFEVDYYRCVDIVAISENISSAFEVKTTFNFKVFEQAVENSKHFNYSSVAVPVFNDWIIQRKLCEDYGVGLLVYDSKRGYNDVREIVHPKLNRHTNNKRLIERLHERNKRSLPGSKSGDGLKITAFGCTVENAVRYVKRHPGCTLKEMVDNIGHHYDSNILARKNLYQWIYKGVIKEISWQYGKLFINQIEIMEQSSFENQRNPRVESFEKNQLLDLLNKYRVEKATNHCYTIYETQYGVVDFYPKANRAMLRKNSQWIKPGLEWLIKELL